MKKRISSKLLFTLPLLFLSAALVIPVVGNSVSDLVGHTVKGAPGDSTDNPIIVGADSDFTYLEIVVGNDPETYNYNGKQGLHYVIDGHLPVNAKYITYRPADTIGVENPLYNL